MSRNPNQIYRLLPIPLQKKKLTPHQREGSLRFAEQKMRALLTLFEEGDHSEIQLVFSVRMNSSGSIELTHRVAAGNP